MNKIEGMQNAFKQAKVVFLTTYSEEGVERSRQMTNFNSDTYAVMWFATERGTRKVQDILRDPRVSITFPSSKPGEFYVIEGKAELAPQSGVDEKWRWWWLYWHPSQTNRFWFPAGTNDPKRVIINVSPESTKLVKK